MNPEALKRIAVLQAMDDAALARLAGVVETRDYADGQVIFQEGDAGDGMYFIASGAVRVEKRTGAAGAGTKILAILEPGDYFGEMALFDQQPRSAAAVAAGATQVLRLSTESFRTLHGPASQAGLSVLFAMIRTSSERIRRLSTQVIVYDEVGKAIGESKTLNHLLDVVLQQLGRGVAADWGLVVLRAQFSDALELRSTLNLTLTPGQRQDVASGKGFLGVALREGCDRLVRDQREDEWLKACAPLGFETPAMLIAPITVDGRSLGLMVLGASEAGQFGLTHLNLARGVARQTSMAILNARSREEEQARARHGRQFVRF